MATQFDFDELTRELARGLSRRKALLSTSFLGGLLVSFGLGRKAWAIDEEGKKRCRDYCKSSCTSELTSGEIVTNFDCIRECVPVCEGCNNGDPTRVCQSSNLSLSIPFNGSFFCIDTNNDPDNCGSCYVKCDEGEICVSGVCNPGNPDVLELLEARVEVVVNPSSRSYTLFNNEPLGSPNFIASFALDLVEPTEVISTPAGWSFLTDNSSYLLWFSTDQQTPYPNHIAPGALLSGFEIQSSVTNYEPEAFTLVSWNHNTDQAGLVLLSSTSSTTE